MDGRHTADGDQDRERRLASEQAASARHLSRSELASRIKDAAVRLVAEMGLSDLDVACICARAGVPEASCRQRWPDVWAVLLEVLDERARLRRLPDEGNVFDDLVAYVQAYRPLYADPSFAALMFQLLAAARSDMDLRERLASGFAKRRARNRVLIERAVARCELPRGVDGDAMLDAILGWGPGWELGARRRGAR
jgi:AcrR family transcriptional regulator